jgi:uncharacterized membrane protein
MNEREPTRGGPEREPVRGGSVSDPVRGGSESDPVRGGSESDPACGGSESDPVRGGSPTCRVSASSGDRQRRLELIVSHLLRAGVVTSMVLLAVGVVVFFARNSGGVLADGSLGSLVGTQARFPTSLAEVVADVAAFRGEGILAAGLLVLIATPVLRVAVSIIGFALERDWIYVGLTVLVLLVLLASFLVGRAV